MLHEFVLPSVYDGIYDFTPKFYFPQDIDIPLHCSKLIKLFYGYVKPLDVHDVRYANLDIAMPLKHLPDKYKEFCATTTIEEYSTLLEAAQHLLYLTLTSVTRDRNLVIDFLKQSRLYDSDSISDDWIDNQIKNYTDPRTIHYTLKVMLLENKFQIINNPTYRLNYEEVYTHFLWKAKEIGREITSKVQLTAGLNRLIKKERGMTAIIRSAKFGKATRFIGIEGLHPTFYYKRILSPSEIRERAKLLD